VPKIAPHSILGHNSDTCRVASWRLELGVIGSWGDGVDLTMYFVPAESPTGFRVARQGEEHEDYSVAVPVTIVARPTPPVRKCWKVKVGSKTPAALKKANGVDYPNAGRTLSGIDASWLYDDLERKEIAKRIIASASAETATE